MVSESTKKNWLRLQVEDDGTKLNSRANKRCSKKRIIPREYFADQENLERVKILLAQIQDAGFRVEDVLYSLAVNLFCSRLFLEISESRGREAHASVKRWLEEYNHCSLIKELTVVKLPEEMDLLGLIYQCLKTEGDKNVKGSYYTPGPLANTLVQGFSFDKKQKYLDPCCGSANLLLQIPKAGLSQLWGIDNDPLAVMIAKANLILRFPEEKVYPQIWQRDFLSMAEIGSFDYIATNPPWGAAVSTTFSGETFAFFMKKSLGLLRQGGILRFLLPEAFLNVRSYRDLRCELLRNYRIEEIRMYANIFSGVTTRFVGICVKNAPPQKSVLVTQEGRTLQIDVGGFWRTKNVVFSFFSRNDLAILDQVESKGTYSLKDSLWALGVVTGDNKRKLSPVPYKGWEPIYTGKEIRPYALLPHRNYILYERISMQQVAREEIYRAPEKLAYKFISDKLVFAYDDSQSLFLNSANLLIPVVKGMNIKSILAFLNSHLFQFLYKKMFGEVKILKGNLLELPFPAITEETNRLLAHLADLAQQGDLAAHANIQAVLYVFYGLEQRQIEQINEVVGVTCSNPCLP